MQKLSKYEFIAQIAFYIAGLYILVKLFIPMISPLSIAADVNSNHEGLYQQILNKSISSFETVMDSYEDEDREELFPLIFKYLTNVDLQNPKTYIASQIPILSLLDITSIISKEEGPIIVIPKDPVDSGSVDNNTVQEGSSNTSSNSGTGTNSSRTSNPSPGGVIVKPEVTKDPASIKLDASKPLVLIVHTHTTEAYNFPGNYSTDLEKGVGKAGEELKKELEKKYGIAVIHDTTIHDLPVREKGYSKSRITIEKYIKKYPSLKIIIDLHRDSAVKNTSTAIINNEKYARIMFVMGAKNKNYSASLAFTMKLNNIFNTNYPGFSRGLYYYKANKFNQDLTTKLVLLELGSNTNSMDEVIRTVKILAKVIATSIK